MTSPGQSRTIPLGELVAAAFDQAARFSDDQRVVARIATRATAGLLSRLAPRTAPAHGTRHRRGLSPRAP